MGLPNITIMKWIKGSLQTSTREFTDIQPALDYAIDHMERNPAHQVKVYNKYGELVEHFKNNHFNNHYKRQYDCDEGYA